MRKLIKFEVNTSTTMVIFLDVSVTLKDGTLKTKLYTKPTDAFLYLHKSLNHPNHVINIIPKGQFIRIRRICSEKEDYVDNCRIICNHFTKRGYDSRKLNEIIKEVGNIDRIFWKKKILKKKTRK